VPIDPIDVPIPPVAKDDPLPAVTFHATGYLRYAFERTRLVKGPPDAPLNPAARVQVQAEGRPARDSQLLAFDDTRHTDESGIVRFRWAASPEALAAMSQPSRLVFEVAGEQVELAGDAWTPPADGSFRAIGPASAGVGDPAPLVLSLGLTSTKPAKAPPDPGSKAASTPRGAAPPSPKYSIRPKAKAGRSRVRRRTRESRSGPPRAPRPPPPLTPAILADRSATISSRRRSRSSGLWFVMAAAGAAPGSSVESRWTLTTG
jgi:hypothetical protein